MPQIPVINRDPVNTSPMSPGASATGLTADQIDGGMGKVLQEFGGTVRDNENKRQAESDKAAEDLYKAEVAKADKAALQGLTAGMLQISNQVEAETTSTTGPAAMSGYDADGVKKADEPGIAESALANFDEMMTALKEKIKPTPEQLAAFASTEITHRASVDKYALLHEISETNKYQKEQTQALANIQLDRLLLAADDKEFQARKTELFSTMTGLYSGDVLEQKKAEILPKIQTQRVVNAITRGDVAGAREIFIKAELNPKSDEYADLTHRLDGAEATVKGAEFVKSLWKTPTDNGPVKDVATLYEAISGKASPLSDEAKRVAEAELSQTLSRYEHDRQTAIHSYKSDLWQGIDDKKLNLSQALKSIDGAVLPGDERVSLKRSVESYFKPPKDPEAAMMARMDQDSNLADLMLKINNGEVRIKTLKDAQAYTAVIGRGNVAKLAGYGVNYEKALSSPQIAAAQFDTIIEGLRSSGVTGLPKKQTGAKGQEYRAMYASLMDELVAKQAKTGKMLDDGEVKKEFRRMVTEKIPVNSRQYFAGVPLWQTTEQKEQWKIQNPAAVKVVDILRARLKREPTKAEVAAGTAAYLKKNPSRREVKQRVPFGGGE